MLKARAAPTNSQPIIPTVTVTVEMHQTITLTDYYQNKK